MSDKSRLLNKIIIAIFLLSLFASCSAEKEKYLYNTELVCPNGSAILVKFVRAKDLKAAIRTSYINKRKLKTSENYTPIRLGDERSFMLRNISPESAITCDLYETRVGEVESSYIHHFR
ncbi:MAG: hypothetical protein EBS06_00180 [Proteobacteria bacterium]|nr:hypothetical protein [Pseudomonadota bacterium]